MLPFSANLELLTSWGRVEQLSGSPGSKGDRLCPGLLLAWDKPSTIWISCLGSLSSATPLVRALRKQPVSESQGLDFCRTKNFSAGKTFLAEGLSLSPSGKANHFHLVLEKTSAKQPDTQPNHGGTAPRPQTLFFIPAAS